VVVVAFLVYGFFVGPILGYVLDPPRDSQTPNP
jgi:hypothetical protein